jgi:hypothetical protein
MEATYTNQWIKFMKNLACRFKNENDLSDVTWTMCQVSEKFQCAFLRFFFHKLGEDCGKVWIEREGTNDDSRPDFIFDYRGVTYLIENKIYDKNQHFKQYVNSYKINPSQLGYIMNYPWAEPGFETHTWKELYKYLQSKKPEEESLLWDAYLEYIKEACNIYLSMNAMNLKGMNSLWTFYQNLGEVFAIDDECINSNISNVDTQNGGNGYCSPCKGAIGQYFMVSFKGIHLRQARGWMGVYFRVESPLIRICFQRERGKAVYSLIEQNIDKFRMAKYSKTPFEFGGAYWFDFIAPDNFDELSLSKQNKILQKFFYGVLISIYKVKDKLLKER